MEPLYLVIQTINLFAISVSSHTPPHFLRLSGWFFWGRLVSFFTGITFSHSKFHSRGKLQCPSESGSEVEDVEIKSIYSVANVLAVNYPWSVCSLLPCVGRDRVWDRLFPQNRHYSSNDDALIRGKGYPKRSRPRSHYCWLPSCYSVTTGSSDLDDTFWTFLSVLTTLLL
jgi:hypothetical protein